MKLSRIILIIILVVVAILAITWNRMPQMLANSLSKKLQVSDEIKDIKVRPGHINIEHLEIGSPQGYHLPRSFSADEISIQAPLLHYFDQNIVIEEIVLDTVYLGIEFTKLGSKEGNWTQIMKNYKENTGGSESSPSEEKGKKNNKSVLIKKLILKNISVDLSYRDSGTVQHLQQIDYLEFTNITSEGGIPADQITNLIMQQMLKAVFSKENLENMIEGFLQSPQQGIQNFLQPFKGLVP